MKPNTKNGKKKLGAETAALIRGTHGMAAKIAALAQPRPLDRAFVSRVISGAKTPSIRFLKALDRALADMRAIVAIQLVRHEHPEIAEHARR